MTERPPEPGRDYWKCDECGRTFATKEDAAGHIDPRPAHDGYRFCAGTAIRIPSERERT